MLQSCIPRAALGGCAASLAGQEKPLHALLQGHGVCFNEKHYRQQAKIERDAHEHEEPTTSERAEETCSPKIYWPKHTCLSELKA